METTEKVPCTCDTLCSIDGLHELIPAENNFACLPTEILSEIFDRVDDVGLLHLASTIPRFEAIAQMAFKRRYNDEYFVIDGESELFDPELYWTQFECFGRSIKAIKLNNLNEIDVNHWIPQMLQKYTRSIEKLHIHRCRFANATKFLSQHLHIRHLTFSRFVDTNCEYVELPRYHHLKSLEVNRSACITIQSLENIFRDNLQLESLKVFYSRFRFTVSMIVYLVSKHLNHLKELEVQQSPTPMNWLINIPDNFIDTSANSFEHLESLSIFADYEFREYLRRFLPKCKNIKRLKLHYLSCEISQMVETIESFDNVKILSLYRPRETIGEIELLVRSLPKLRQFILSFETFSKTDYVDTLSLLRKYANLEKIVIENTDSDSTHYVDVLLYHKLVGASLNPTARVEFRTSDGKVTGFLTKKQLIWKKRLMHWIGYDPIYSRSTVGLLDLAEPQRTSTESTTPFELILDYLDLSSLCALSKVCSKSTRLVQRYIQTRSKQQKKFVITNEFPIQYEGLHIFGPLINNLEVINMNVAMTYHERQNELSELHLIIEKYFINLRKFSFYSKADLYPFNFIFPQIRHMTFCAHSGYCELSTWSNICPNLETLELNSRITYGDKLHSFCNLRKFVFNSSEQTETEVVTQLFQNTQTELVINCD